MRDLIFLDIGARGDIPLEWYKFLEYGHSLEIHTFDVDEQINLPTHKQIKFINHSCGLWSKVNDLDFFLCKVPEQSSCYKPNKQIKVFEPKNHNSRLQFEKKSIKNISTLDIEFENKNSIDFIKCDTQGAEMKISEGATNIMHKCAPIFALETWSDYVYEKIPLDFEIKSFYYERGYRLFLSDSAAGYWKYDTKGRYPKSQGRFMGDNLLFVPNLELLAKLSEEDLISKIIVLAYFRFYDYCYYVLSELEKKDLLVNVDKIYNRSENLRSDLYRKSVRIGYESRKMKNFLRKFGINTTPKIT